MAAGSQRFAAAALGVALGAGLMLGGAAPAAAKAGPMAKASKSDTKALLSDLNLVVPAKCVKFRLVRINRSWGSYSPKTPPPQGCPAVGDASTIVVKQGGTWRGVPLMNNLVTCAEFRAALRSNGAPKKVATALAKAAYGC